MNGAARRLGATVAWPAAGFAVLILFWHWLAASGRVPSFLLPAPGRVAGALRTLVADGTLWPHLAATLEAAAAGYVLGALLAAALAALVAEFRTVERFLLLHLIAVQSIPKVAIAPLIFLWAGFGLGGKVALVALICFFPIFANALTGFRAADPNLVDLMRASGASRGHIFFHVKLPSALGHLFAGLEVSVAFALIGCIVMEFVGSTRGLGFLILDSSNRFDLPLNFAAVILLGLLGVLGNALVRAVRRRVLFWEGERGAAAPVAGAAHA